MTSPLRIAILHYHLRPGGVTQVIKHAVAALRKTGRVETCIFSGAAPVEDAEAFGPVIAIPELNYSSNETGASVPEIVEAMRRSAAETLGGPLDVWHFHNHSIGKNTTFPHIVSTLAREGERLLLQIHDFPEDGRPANFGYLLSALGGGSLSELEKELYPRSRGVHYAVLNSRDHRFLLEAGPDHRQCHLLPDPVFMKCRAATSRIASDTRTFIYPTRAIRRKNVGEFLLWSALGEPHDRFAMTLAPTSPGDKSFYDAWKGFAKALDLPVDFEVGMRKDMSFEEQMASAHAVVSTSVAEGFGLAFLEPWLLDKQLLGRDIPEITESFKQDGVSLERMYQRLLVPLSLVDKDEFKLRIEERMTALLAAYGRVREKDSVERAYQAAIVGSSVDFGHLDEDLQQRVIRRLRADKSLQAEISPTGLEWSEDNKGENLVARNQAAVKKAYNIEQYGERLVAILDKVMSTTGEESGPCVEALLDRFLAPERFSLLRT